MTIDMDGDKIRFPMEFLREAEMRDLLGCRRGRHFGGKSVRNAPSLTAHRPEPVSASVG